MDISEQQIIIAFPLLSSQGYQLTSPHTTSYNCIAWAAEDNTRVWWPDPQVIGYWPSDVPREETLAAFILLFQKFGYEECDNKELEEGFKKVAIYTDTSGKPTHAARQLESGKWTSKLGRDKDIEHTLEGLVSVTYGKVSKIMKKSLGNKA